MAVNRYFDRTLMPYNPIERPMPFDQILQAGLMKQQSLDRTLAAVDEFSEQKMLVGGARTLDAAKQLNQKYIGKASDLTNKIMTGAITPEQAGFELRNINKEYNKSNAVKQVLADQGLSNLSNQASVNQRLLANRAENPNWDYDAGAFRQESVEDLETGRATIDARGYGVMEDPGLFEDFSAELGQIHEQYIKESGITNFYYDQNTGQFKETATNNVIEISEERVKELINDYVYRGDISETDKQSVLYRMARRKRLDPDNPYDEEDLANDLYQAASFIPYRSTQTTQDIAGVGGKSGKGKTPKASDAPLPVVTAELGAEASGLQYSRTAVYGISNNNPVEGMRKLLSSDESRLEGANKKLGIKNYKLKEGSTIENPEFVYASGDNANTPVLEMDAKDAKAELNEFKTDIKWIEQVERMASRKFERATGKSFTDFMNETEQKYEDDISRWILTSTENRLLRDNLGEILDPETRQELISETSNIAGEKNVVYSESDGTILVSLDYLMPDSPTGTVQELEARRDSYLNKPASDGNRIGNSYYMQQGGRTQRLKYVPIEFAGETNPEIKSLLDEYVRPKMALEFLQKNDRGAYNTYMSAKEAVKKTLDENNNFKMGLALNTLEGTDGRRDHRVLQEELRDNESITLRRSEGKPGSGEKAGITMRRVYAALGPEVSAEDFKATHVYLNEGPDGNVQMYARMQWNPKSGTELADGVDIDNVEVDGEKGSFRDFDVNATQYMEEFFGNDIGIVYHASALMKDHVYTMDVGDTRPVYIPSKYGPAAEVNVTKGSTGVTIDGFIYGEDENGAVIKKDVMEYYYEVTGAPRGSSMSEDKAAEFAGKVATSAHGVALKHPELFGKNGEYLGGDVPSSIEDRRTQVRDTLTNNISKITSKFSSEYNESFTEYEDPDQKTVDELFKIMEFETANTFNPNQRNANQGPGTAVGLIQFYKDDGKELVKTIGDKKFTFAELGRMSIPEQIEKAVVPYLNEVGGRVKSVDDLYFAVFMPVFAGMDKSLSLEDAVRLAESRGANMKKLQPHMLRASNPAFKDARNLQGVLDKVRGYKK